MDKRIDGKIAVFICGPVRYATLVNERLETVLKDYDYDCFFHLWKSDLGNKVRRGWESDYTELFAHPRAKVVVMQSPYSEDDFEDKIGTKTNSGSTINATMGMFFSVNALCHYLRQLPDFDEYKYILRLRTDLAILNDDFASLLSFEPNVLTVVRSSITPEYRISDQICFGSIGSFFKIWAFEDMEDIYEAYRKGFRSPERTVALRYKQWAKDMHLHQGIVKFRDYHIVRFPPREGFVHVPECILKALERMGVQEFFRNGGKSLDLEEIDRFNDADHEEEPHFEQIYEFIRNEHESLHSNLMRSITGRFLSIEYGVSSNETIDEECRKMVSFLEGPELEEAEKILRFILVSHPGHVGAERLSKHLGDRLNGQELFERGVDVLNRGNTTQAIDYFDEAISNCRPFPELNFARAVAFAKLGKLLPSKKACQDELKVNPESEGAKNLLAKIEKATNEAVQTTCG